MSDQYLSCWRWKRDEYQDTLWSTYPTMAEKEDSQEVTILFWKAPPTTGKEQ